ncbi:guanine nucleotide exchange factor for Rab-3A-like [Babylonia areolata]|uniref:guanine nucleotide exchange factor for Rab-3A-like n=1 Tax=Babylonia areolata TaxID=304850 RepID=UPI003FD229FC
MAHNLTASLMMPDASVPADSTANAGTRANHITNGGSGLASQDSFCESENDDLSPQGLRLEFPMPLKYLNRRRCSQSFIDAKEHAYARLMAELSKAQRELELKDEECDKLCKLRGQMEEELDDLTASLFEEANKSIQDAHLQRIKAQKRLEDATHQIDILQGEVTALKHLVVTSTPSSPNRHLHPQISDSGAPKKNSRPFWKRHRRSTSHHEFSKETQVEGQSVQSDGVKEVDAVCFDEFQQWREKPSITDASSTFLSRVFSEDIQPCLNFANTALAERVLQCVQQNTLSIEPIPGDRSFPRKCCLSNTHKLCNYKIKLEEEEEWYSISQMCRNRIAAVCDFYTYIRYICQNLVKSADKEMFQEISKLRLRMASARLGC